MTTTNQIIEEALKWRIEEECYSVERNTILGKLFSNPLFPFRKSSKKGGENSVILYLSERLMNEINEKDRAQEEFDLVFKIARKCVSVYGMEAERNFLDMWKKFTIKTPPTQG